MTTDVTQQLLDKLRVAVSSLSVDGIEADPSTSNSVHSWALQVLQDGFQGSSSLPHVWSVVSAMGRAHPLLLSKDIQAAAERAHDNSRAALHAWVTMALQSGSFSTFIRSLPTQPQVVCAYAATAPVRQRTFCTHAAALLLDAQGAICEHFLQQEQHQQQQQMPEEAGSDAAALDDSHVVASGPDAKQHSASIVKGILESLRPKEEANDIDDTVSGSVSASAGQQPQTQHKGTQPHILPATAGQQELTNIVDSRPDAAEAVPQQGTSQSGPAEADSDTATRQAPAAIGSSADVSSQPSEASWPMLHIETEEDALARRQAAAGVRGMSRLWPPVPRAMASETKPGSTGGTQDGSDVPGSGTVLTGQQQAVAKAAAAGWQGALLALDYAKQGVGQARLNWAWPRAHVQANSATGASPDTKDKPTSDTAPTTTSMSTGKHSWMLPGRWRQLSRPASQSGNESLEEQSGRIGMEEQSTHEGREEGALVRVHLSVQCDVDGRQQQEQATGADDGICQQSAREQGGQVAVHVQVSLEVCHPVPSGTEAGRGGAVQQLSCDNTAIVAEQQQRSSSATEAASSTANGACTGAASPDTEAGTGVEAATCAAASSGAEASAASTSTEAAAAAAGGGYGLASWMRGTAATATAAGVLSQVQWRNAAANMFSAVATATNAVAVRRPVRAASGAGITPAGVGKETSETPAEIQPSNDTSACVPNVPPASGGNRSSGHTSANQMSSSLQAVDGEEECDMLEDMREVLQGGGGLMLEQYRSSGQMQPSSGTRPPSLHSSRPVAMLHTESLPVLHSGALRSVSSQSQLQLPAGHRRTSSAQPGQAAPVPHIVLHPPNLQAELPQDAPIAASEREHEQGGSTIMVKSPKLREQQQQQQQQQQEIAHVMVLGHQQRVDEYGEQYTTYELEVQSEHGNSWKVHRRFSEFVTLKKALVALQQQQQQQQATHPSSPPGKHEQAGHNTAALKQTQDKGAAEQQEGGSLSSSTRAVVLPVSWDQVSQSRGVLGRARMSADVIHSREALISKCMSQLLAANSPPRPAALQQLLLTFLKARFSTRNRPHSDSGSSSSSLQQDLRQQAAWTGTGPATVSAAGLLQPTTHASTSFTSQHASHSVTSSMESLPISQGSLSRSDPGSGQLLAAMASARTAQAAEPGQQHSHSSNSPLGAAASVEPGQSVARERSTRPTAGTAASAGTSQDPAALEQGSGSELSMTVRFIVDPLPSISDLELLRRQGGKCAGCKGPLPAPNTAGRSGWLLTASSPGSMTGPLRCWYTNKLYCSTCHTGNTQFIPAAVIHSWDFTARPVCIAAADYLRAVRNQPVLCVPAVNPGLYARVPALAEAAQLRRRIAGHLQAADNSGGVLAQRVAQIRSSAGLRSYLLVPELLDWWALSDLLDLSLGAFAKMPAWLDKVARQAGALAAAGLPPPSETAE